jgi:hypothetical protein
MEEITFKGPYHIKDLSSVSNELRKEYAENKIPGIYIWGFVSDIKIENFKDFSEEHKIPKFNKENELFIPYYVGLDSDLFDRINKHKGFDKYDARKYTRMSEEYMKKFFKEKAYPIKTDNSNINKDYFDLNINEQENIVYYNNSDFLKKVYGDFIKVDETKKTENPIDVINKDNNNLIIDTLKEMYDDSNQMKHKNNLWFCYAELKRNTDFVKCKLEDFETLTFYSLKGKTISKTGKLEAISDTIAVKYKDNLKSIFKSEINSKNSLLIIKNKTNVEFPGYL